MSEPLTSIDCGVFDSRPSVADPITQDAKHAKRIRKRSLAVALEVALRDAEAAATADISTQKLIQTRLNILSKALARERHDKWERTEKEVERLTVENSALKQELAAKPAAARPLTEVEQVLAKHEARKQNGGAQ